MTKTSSSLLTPNCSTQPPIKWLITGGCGFIGRNLIQQLIQDGGHLIRALDNLSVGTREDLEQICDYREFSEFSERSHVNCEKLCSCTKLAVGDIRDYNTCLTCCKDIDIVVHLAANTGVGPSIENPRLDMETNVIGTLNMLESARQNNVKRFIFASSGAAIGEYEPPIHEELAPHPVSPYGASKLAGEAYCSAYFRTFGIKTVVLRFGNVYGPLSGQKNSVVAKFIKRAMEGKPLEIYGDGTQTRDFIFVEDLIKAILLSATSRNISGEIFQIATNKETSVNELTEELISVIVNFGLKKVVKVYAKHPFGEVKRNFSDISKAQDLLSWYAKASLTEGLEKTVEWFLKKGF
jgi:UDP-glucose 4-epimerase